MQVNDKLSFDVGFRHAVTNGSNVNEFRAGLTIGFMTPFGRLDQNRCDPAQSVGRGGRGGGGAWRHRRCGLESQHRQRSVG
jgi:hypothetical protein